MRSALSNVELLLSVQYRSHSRSNLSDIFRKRRLFEQNLATKRINIYFDDTIEDMLKFAVINYPSDSFRFLYTQPSFQDSSFRLLNMLESKLHNINIDILRKIFMNILNEKIQVLQNNFKTDTMDDVAITDEDIQQGYQSKPVRQRKKIERLKTALKKNHSRNENLIWIHKNFPVLDETPEQKTQRLEAERQARESAALFQKQIRDIENMENQTMNIMSQIALTTKIAQRIPTDQIEHEVIVESLKKKLEMIDRLIEKEVVDQKQFEALMEDHNRISRIVKSFETVLKEWNLLFLETQKELKSQQMELQALENAISNTKKLVSDFT